MITIYGYDKDNDIYDNIAEIHDESFNVTEQDVLHEIVWCAKFLTHHARSSSGDEYDWLCISKDNRNQEEDMIMSYKADSSFAIPVIVLECKNYKEHFNMPESIVYSSFDFIGW